MIPLIGKYVYELYVVIHNKESKIIPKLAM